MMTNPSDACEQFNAIRRHFGEVFQVPHDLPEVLLVDGIYSAYDVLPSGVLLRAAVRADDRKAHLCVEHPELGRACMTKWGFGLLAGTVKHVKQGPSQQRSWVKDRLRDKHPTWCHVAATA